MQQSFTALFQQRFGAAPDHLVRLHPDGSDRRYFRLAIEGGPTAIGVMGPDLEENEAFFSFTRALRGAGLPVPELYGVDEGREYYLEEDLGDTTLFDALSAAREGGGGNSGTGFPESMIPAYRRVVEMLPRFQVEGGRAVDYSRAYPREAFDRQSIMWDLNYFKYHFLKLAHIPFSEARLERDFRRLAAFLLRADTRHFLYRDFQSRNVMLRDGEPWFVDYQGGRRGAPQYDIASILYDAKAAIPAPVREQLLDHYLDALGGMISFDRDLFLVHFRGYVLVRIMQALGAYGYRGFYERKRHFLQSVPPAIRNIEELLNEGLLPIDVPELEAVFRRMIDRPELRREAETPPPGLTVRIGSFSYRKGIPEDDAGHGGGFVFDCRALPNPGRDSRYADLCGLDRPVVDFIDELPETTTYWDSIRSLVDQQVEEYLRRRFNSLTVQFGCTGGQHRSVYFAERLAEHLQARYPQVNVRRTHREESSWPEREMRPEGEDVRESELAAARNQA